MEAQREVSLENEEERVDAWEKATCSSTGNKGSGNLRALMRRSISNTDKSSESRMSNLINISTQSTCTILLIISSIAN